MRFAGKSVKVQSIKVQDNKVQRALKCVVNLTLSVVLVAGLLPAYASAESAFQGAESLTGASAASLEEGEVAGEAAQASDSDVVPGEGDATDAGAADGADASDGSGASGDEDAAGTTDAGSVSDTGASEGAGTGNTSGATDTNKPGVLPDGTLSLNTALSELANKDAVTDQDKDQLASEKDAEDNEEELAPLSQEVSAAWPSFRGNDKNNGIVNFDIPTNANEAQLLWSKQFGTSWSDAPSTQLIVDDSLVVMSGTSIYKLDLNTGTVKAQGSLYDGFNWGYTPFAYGEGKIFVSLKSGKVQALDATTLESLWVYSDPLGGQSVSPVVYSDGYVYTGFWNSEKRDANYVCLKAEDEDRTQATEAKAATWSITNAGGYYWAGAVAIGDYLIFGSDDGITAETGGTSYLRCVNKETGEVISTLALDGLGDQRSSLCYAPEEGKLFFTTKSGYICSASINATSGQLSNLSSSRVRSDAASTSTPVYYKGKLYFGIGAGYEGGEKCRFVVADAGTLETIASVQAPGDVKSSPLLSTATEDSGYLCFYFTYNSQPGGISVVKVKNDCESDNDVVIDELFDASAYSQYCICSVIASSNGTLYYKNDSCNIIAVGFTDEGRQAAANRHAGGSDGEDPFDGGGDSGDSDDSDDDGEDSGSDDSGSSTGDDGNDNGGDPSTNDNNDTSEPEKTANTTTTGGTTKSLGTSKDTTTSTSSSKSSTEKSADESDASADEVVYTAQLVDSDEAAATPTSLSAQEQENTNSFPWHIVLIAAALLLVAALVARIVLSAKDKEEAAGAGIVGATSESGVLQPQSELQNEPFESDKKA